MIKKLKFPGLSSLLMVFAFPPFDLWLIAWFGMVPLFFAVYEETPSVVFKTGFVWGFVFFAGTVYWVVNSMVNYGGVSIYASVLVLLLLVTVLSIYPAVFVYLASKLTGENQKSSVKNLIVVPCIWVSIEYIRTHLFTGFPWVLLGYSQTRNLAILQVADITGVYGISFLIVMFNFFIFLSTSHFLKNGGVRFKEGAAVFLIIAVVSGYGYIRINQIDELVKNWKKMNIGIVQGNIDQSVKWNPEYQEKTVEIYSELSMGMKDKGIELIVWPETATPFYLQDDERLSHNVLTIAKTLSAKLITGSPAYGYAKGGGAVNYYNSVFLISKGGNIIGRYDKVHLVPFGEYVPLKRFLPFEKLVAGVGDFSPGSDMKPLSLNNGAAGILICFEAIFPHAAREFLKNGADFLITVTNDAWFGKSSAPYQHLSQSLARAVEGRVYLVRAANTGISAVVDPVGRIKTQSGIFTRESLIGTISLKEKSFKTFYTRYGDVFAIGCMIISIVMFINIIRYFKKARL